MGREMESKNGKGSGQQEWEGKCEVRMGKELGNKNGKGSWEVRIGRVLECKNGKGSKYNICLFSMNGRMGRRVFHSFPFFSSIISLPLSLINFSQGLIFFPT